MKRSGYLALYLTGVAWFFISEPLWSGELISTAAANSLNFCQIDSDSGEVRECWLSLIGISPSDLASAPTLGIGVWAITHDNLGDAGNELVEFDTASASVVARISISRVEEIDTLAIDSTDGSFYGTSQHELLRFDPATGEFELVGLNRLIPNKGLAFDNGGRLFGVSNASTLVQVDKSNGMTAIIGEMPLFRMEDIAFDPIDNTMFGIGYDGQYRLYRIDPATADVEVVGPSAIRPSGLAFANVPEPSHCVPLALGLLAIAYRRGYRI